MIAQSTVSELERGMKGTRREQVVRIDKALIAHDVLVNSWDTAFSPSGMTNYFREVAEAEQTAVEIREYALGLVPGLFQVAEYARAISQIGSPHATPEGIEQIVSARLKRQEILKRPHPPRVTVLLDETVLLRSFSDPGVMSAQINHLIAESHRSRVTIQIVPMRTEGHAGLGGAFMLSSAPDRGTFAYVEGHESGMSLKEPEIVSGYDRTFAELRSAALPVPASRSLMERIRGGNT